MRSAAFACLALLVAGSTSALAQGAGAFSPIPGGWRWSRGPASFDLLGKDGRAWTAAEADAVRQSLDLLPDVLLRKAASVSVRRLYRGGSLMATTKVQSGHIVFGDSLFGATPTVARVYQTVVHELGHCAQYAVVGNGPLVSKLQAVLLGTPGWTSISWTSPPLVGGLRSWNGFVSDYARTNDREDFAESVEFYWLAPDELLRVSPAKFAYMRDVVFERVVSPAASRLPGKAAIAPVGPVVTRLGDTRDDHLSLVKVHGQHFMGLRDGGSISVRYRGSRALHLRMSRATVWSWVPLIAPGAADVTVVTQDGTSNATPFVVEKAWWKFW